MRLKIPLFFTAEFNIEKPHFIWLEWKRFEKKNNILTLLPDKEWLQALVDFEPGDLPACLHYGNHIYRLLHEITARNLPDAGKKRRVFATQN